MSFSTVQAFSVEPHHAKNPCPNKQLNACQDLGTSTCLCAAWGTMLCGVAPQESWAWHQLHRLLLVYDALSRAYTWRCASHQHRPGPTKKKKKPQNKSEFTWSYVQRVSQIKCLLVYCVRFVQYNLKVSRFHLGKSFSCEALQSF